MQKNTNIVIGGMQEHQSIKTDGICTCLTSSMGMGGGYVPMTIEVRKVDIMREQKGIVEQHDICRLGNVNGKSGGSFAGQVYSDNGLCPTLTDMQGGGRQPHVLEIKKANYVIMPQTVRVRTHEVNKEKLQSLLRSKKKDTKVTNEQIANILNIPKTKVEHWFRTDNFFDIPDSEYWFSLKDILHIETDEFDVPISEFEERDGVFDKAERIYLPDCIAPTITTMSANDKCIEVKLMSDKVICAMRGRDPENPSDRTAGNPNLEQRLEPNSEGICNTITTVQKDNLVLVKQATKEGYVNCQIGGGGRFELSDKSNEKRSSNRERKCLPDSDNGEYP